MSIKIIAAVGLKGEIGRNNDLCWRIAADLKRFRALTVGQIVVMGRRTYESIGHPLAERLNIVVSRTLQAIPGCVVVSSFQRAIEYAQDYSSQLDIYCIGGGELYKAAVPVADEVLITRIYNEALLADTWFPFDLMTNYLPMIPEDGDAYHIDKPSGLMYKYCTYLRKPNIN
jgi:Dihydrofolate reductase